MALDKKKDCLWIKWLHSYYIKQADVWAFNVPRRLLWDMRNFFNSRTALVDSVTCSQSVHNGKCFIKKLYWFMRGDSLEVNWTRITCNRRVNLKVVFITWLLLQGRISTKDRLIQWGIVGDQRCILCNAADETKEHLFFTYSCSQQIWSVCFS